MYRRRVSTSTCLRSSSTVDRSTRRRLDASSPRHGVERLDQRRRTRRCSAARRAGRAGPRRSRAPPPRASAPGRVMRLARYSPIHVAPTRISSVTIRKNDRYTPVSGPLEHAQLVVALEGLRHAAGALRPARRSGSRSPPRPRTGGRRAVGSRPPRAAGRPRRRASRSTASSAAPLTAPARPADRPAARLYAGRQTAAPPTSTTGSSRRQRRRSAGPTRYTASTVCTRCSVDLGRQLVANGPHVGASRGRRRPAPARSGAA